MLATTDMISEGEALFERGDLAGAKTAFWNALRANPNDTKALNNLGVIAFHQNDSELALDYFLRALTVSPENADAAANINDCLSQLPHGQLSTRSRLAGAAARICLVGLSEDIWNEIYEIIPQLNSSDLKPIVRYLLHYTSTNQSDHLQTIYGNMDAAATEARKEIEQWFGHLKISLQSRVDIESMLERDDAPSRPKRVLHGSYEVANQMRTTTLALRKLGWEAKTLCLYPNYLKFDSDYVLDLESMEDQNYATEQSHRLAEKLIPEFDLFHFHFGTSLTRDWADLPVIKSQNKGMVAHFWGSEVRRYSLARKINPYVKVKVVDESAVMRRLDTLSNYIKHCIVGDHELAMYVDGIFENVHVVRSMIDVDDYVPLPEEDRPERDLDSFVIVHAPTSPELKGSHYIEAAIEELSDSYKIDYRRIEKMAHEEARRQYALADLVVDELHIGTYGLLTVECMAMERPVITWVCDQMREKYPAELPIIAANPDTVKEKIKWALDNRDALPELGKKGREYVRKHHDMNVVVNDIIGVYEAIS